MNVAPGGENISHFDVARLSPMCLQPLVCVQPARASLRLGAVLGGGGGAAEGQGKGGGEAPVN